MVEKAGPCDPRSRLCSWHSALDCYHICPSLPLSRRNHSNCHVLSREHERAMTLDFSCIPLFKSFSLIHCGIS